MKEYIIGQNHVIEALRAERDINKIWIAEGSQKGSMQQITQISKRSEIFCQFVPKKKIDQMVEGNHQGVVAQVAAYQYAELDDLFAAAEKRNEASILSDFR